MSCLFYTTGTDTIRASFDSRWSVILGGRRTGMERSATTRSERALSSRLPPRTEDRSVPVVVPWCDLTMYCALSARPSFSADLSPRTGYYKLDFVDTVRWSCRSSAIAPPKSYSFLLLLLLLLVWIYRYMSSAVWTEPATSWCRSILPTLTHELNASWCTWAVGT